MQKTTVNDTAILDALEALLGDVSISFERNYLGGEWTVTTRAYFADKSGEKIFSTGGGTDLRDAFSSMIANHITKQLTQ